MNPIDPAQHDEESGHDRPVEGEYLAPNDHPASGRNWKAAGGWAVGLALFAAKFKGLLIAILNFKYLLFAAKYGLTAFSFLATVWFYGAIFGWKFGIVFVLLIAIHECGHAIFVRGYGLAAPAIVFVPGMGAFTAWSGDLNSAYKEAVIAFGGPLLGTLGSAACLSLGLIDHDAFWIACAYTGFLLNLINMVPFGFFDGGRIAGAITPALWAGGLVVIVAAALIFHWWSPLLLLFVLLGVPKAISAFRGQLDPKYYAVTGAERATVSLLYFGLLAVLAAGVIFTHTGGGRLGD